MNQTRGEITRKCANSCLILESPLSVPGGPVMKCRFCNCLCSDHQPTCIECRRSLVPPFEPPPHLPRRTGTLFAALGLAISISFLPPNFPAKEVGPINVGRTLVIAGITTVCWPIGYLVGTLINRSRRAQFRVPESAVSR